MIREKIIVPSGIRFISEWNEFNFNKFQVNVLLINNYLDVVLLNIVLGVMKILFYVVPERCYLRIKRINMNLMFIWS